MQPLPRDIGIGSSKTENHHEMFTLTSFLEMYLQNSIQCAITNLGMADSSSSLQHPFDEVLCIHSTLPHPLVESCFALRSTHYSVSIKMKRIIPR